MDRIFPHLGAMQIWKVASIDLGFEIVDLRSAKLELSNGDMMKRNKGTKLICNKKNEFQIVVYQPSPISVGSSLHVASSTGINLHDSNKLLLNCLGVEFRSSYKKKTIKNKSFQCLSVARGPRRPASSFLASAQ